MVESRRTIGNRGRRPALRLLLGSPHGANLNDQGSRPAAESKTDRAGKVPLLDRPTTSRPMHWKHLRHDARQPRQLEKHLQAERRVERLKRPSRPRACLSRTTALTMVFKLARQSAEQEIAAAAFDVDLTASPRSPSRASRFKPTETLNTLIATRRLKTIRHHPILWHGAVRKSSERSLPKSPASLVFCQQLRASARVIPLTFATFYAKPRHNLRRHPTVAERPPRSHRSH